MATKGTKHHLNRSHRFRAVADLVDPPYMFRAANIGSSFKTVRDRHMVNMKHYWEVDFGLSESAKKFDLGTWMTLTGSFQSHESENDQYRLNGCS